MDFLGIRLSKAQKDYLNTNKFLLIPKAATAFKGKVHLGACSPAHYDEMLGLFDMVCGKQPDVERRPENARFVNPDVVLHGFHKFFENSLKYLEKTELAALLRRFLRKNRPYWV